MLQPKRIESLVSTDCNKNPWRHLTILNEKEEDDIPGT